MDTILYCTLLSVGVLIQIDFARSWFQSEAWSLPNYQIPIWILLDLDPDHTIRIRFRIGFRVWAKINSGQFLSWSWFKFISWSWSISLMTTSGSRSDQTLLRIVHILIQIWYIAQLSVSVSDPLSFCWILIQVWSLIPIEWSGFWSGSILMWVWIHIPGLLTVWNTVVL